MNDFATSTRGSPARPGCLSEQTLDRVAGGEDPGEAESAHLNTCDSCRERLRRAEEDSAFLTRTRSLVSDLLGPVNAPRIPGYRVLQVISSGAQGTVYKAVQDSTSRVVAIKTQGEGAVLTDRLRARAEREAEITARLKHPNVVSVYESRVLEDGRVAVVMEFVDGVPLDSWTLPGRTPAQRQRAVLHALSDVCAGLHHAHLNGVIHRDVKPANILIAGEGRPVLVDFGIAKLGSIGETMVGELTGTPAYASPEQAAGLPEQVDAMTDVYSMGVVLYQLLCGRLPYALEGSLFDMARTIAEEEPARPRDLCPGLAPDLEAIVLKALSKPKQMRYESAAALGRDLQRFLCGEPVEARRGSGWYLLRKAIFVNRRLLTALAAGVLVFAGVVAAYSINRAREARSAERESLLRQQAHREQVQAQAVGMLLRETMPRLPPTNAGERSPVEFGLMRVRNLLITNALADDPELDSAMRVLWGSVYSGSGTAEHASFAEWAEESLRIGLMDLFMQGRGESADCARLTQTLAQVLLNRRNLLEAERQARRALGLRERLFGPRSVQAAETWALLAKIAQQAGRPDEALRASELALGVFEGRPGDADAVLSASLNALRARIELSRGVDAGPRVRAALVTQVRLLPPTDHELIESYELLATLAHRSPESAVVRELGVCWEVPAGELSDAVRADADLLKSPLAVRPPGRPDAFERMSRVQSVLLGREHLSSVGILMAQLHDASLDGNHGREAECWSRVTEILSKRFGARSFCVLTCVESESVSRLYNGEPDRAVELVRRAIEIVNQTPDEVRDPMYAINQQRYLAWFLAAGEHYDQAIEHWRAVIAQVSALYGTKHHYVISSNIGIALCLSQLGRLEEADEQSTKVLVLAEDPALPFDWRANALVARALVLHKLGNHAAARPLYERAWEKLYKSYGPKYPWRRLLLRELAETCERLSDAEAAARWRALLDDSASSR